MEHIEDAEEATLEGVKDLLGMGDTPAAAEPAAGEAGEPAGAEEAGEPEGPAAAEEPVVEEEYVSFDEPEEVVEEATGDEAGPAKPAPPGERAAVPIVDN